MDQVPKDWDKQQIKLGASFLQSGLWGEFQSVVDVTPHFISGAGWSCLLLQKRNRIGTYLFSQYGPTVDSAKALEESLKFMANYGRQLGAAWLSLEPMSRQLPADEIRQLLLKYGARPAVRHREPDLTRIVDLTPSADDLLASISQSTRSLIRKNQREKLVTFKSSTNPKDISIFTQMLRSVSERKNVWFYNDSYFKKQAELLMPAGVMRLEIALLGGQPVACALFHDFDQTSTYTFAGSLPGARKTNASALLLWQALLNAKDRGMKQVDLYGIAPDGAPASHPWAGFTAFKAKFGGHIEQYAGAWDIPLNSRYRAYQAAHRVRKIIKRH